ncbi:MAG: acyl-CoA dehydrogenase family protein [bacterium]|nr:acyl-CoA dehydrogenase family protein [bacterium]
MSKLDDIETNAKKLTESVAIFKKDEAEEEKEGRGLNFELTATQKQIRTEARKVIEETLKPVVLELDQKHQYPRDFLKQIGDLGYMGIWLPEKYGGAELGIISLVLITEEIARVCAGASAAYGATALGALPILLNGTEEQREKYLTKIASGAIASFAITESGSGSDAFAMTTKAVRDGDYYVLNGEKQFITNSGEADICVVFAKTKKNDRGFAGFIIERGTPGFNVGPNRRKMGLHCSDTRDISLSDCRVHKDNLLGGTESAGILAVLNTFPRSRIVVGAQGVGLAKGVFANAWEYAEQTRRFGKKVNEFQPIQYEFSEMECMIETAETLVYKAACFVDRGVKAAKDRNEMVRLASLAKWYCADVAFNVANKAVGICAGSGYMEENGTEKRLRDAKALQIYEGTANIQRNEIFLALVRGPKKIR